jgi:NAD(P)-dependent dehydrogenase (short-subunit alcohol dehydrogenase family)
MGRLEGKVALVTGAAGGIGRTVVKRFISEGGRVIALDLHANAMADAFPQQISDESVLPVVCDISNSDEVRAAIKRATNHFGGLNILCNIAGGSSPADNRVTEAPESEFWRVIRIDLFGTFLVCKFGIPELIKAGGGSVINLTSMAAIMAIPQRDSYTAAKGGVAAMTRSMAAGYGAEGVRVNAIAPGITMSARVSAMANSPGQQALAERHLLGLLDPVDIAQLAVFLASDESRHVTGQIMQVDSGVTIA